MFISVGGGFSVNNAKITYEDINLKNGALHMINTFLIPIDLFDAVMQTTQSELRASKVFAPLKPPKTIYLAPSLRQTASEVLGVASDMSNIGTTSKTLLYSPPEIVYSTPNFTKKLLPAKLELPKQKQQSDPNILTSPDKLEIHQSTPSHELSTHQRQTALDILTVAPKLNTQQSTKTSALLIQETRGVPSVVDLKPDMTKAKSKLIPILQQHQQNSAHVILTESKKIDKTVSTPNSSLRKENGKSVLRNNLTKNQQTTIPLIQAMSNQPSTFLLHEIPKAGSVSKPKKIDKTLSTSNSSLRKQNEKSLQDVEILGNDSNKNQQTTRPLIQATSNQPSTLLLREMPKAGSVTKTTIITKIKQSPSNVVILSEKVGQMQQTHPWKQQHQPDKVFFTETPKIESEKTTVLHLNIEESSVPVTYVSKHSRPHETPMPHMEAQRTENAQTQQTPTPRMTTHYKAEFILALSPELKKKKTTTRPTLSKFQKQQSNNIIVSEPTVNKRSSLSNAQTRTIRTTMQATEMNRATASTVTRNKVLSRFGVVHNASESQGAPIESPAISTPKPSKQEHPSSTQSLENSMSLEDQLTMMLRRRLPLSEGEDPSSGLARRLAMALSELLRL